MDWYCPLPFKHAFVDSTGVSVCCQAPRQKLSLDEWTNSDYLSNFQQHVLNGKPPAECFECVKQENAFGHSLRTSSMSDYNHQIFNNTQIDFIDYRSNNICNFKCRSCAPNFSHGIANETKKSSVLQKYFSVPESKTVSVDAVNVKWIHQNLTSIKRLQLTGGEPTYMPELKPVLEQIIYDDLDIDVMITTNASFVDDFWCEFTRRCKRLHWTVSLDAVGAAAEIVRHGTKWPVVERNIRWLVQHAQSVDFNTVISNINVMQLKPLLEFVNEMQKESRYPRGYHGTQGCRHQFFVCLSPSYLSADNWPVDMLPKVQEHLQQCMNIDLNDEQKQTVDGLLKRIESKKFDPILWKKTQDYNQELNYLRNEDHTRLYRSHV